jgi:hypothetical protein
MTKTLNSATLDHNTEEGIRISLPIYVDIPMGVRKTLYNSVREEATRAATVLSSPKTVSGIQVTTYQVQENSVSQYLGASLDVLRTLIFQRGGLQLDLVLRLQEVAGYEVLTKEALAKAFDERKEACISYADHNPYTRS